MDILFIDTPCGYRESIDFNVEGSLLDLRRKCVNPGLLNIASWCEFKGLNVKLLASDSMDVLKKKIDEAICFDGPKLVVLSVMSGMSYVNALIIIDYIKKLNQNIRVIAGGWHIHCINSCAFKDSKMLDAICVCEGEEAIYEYYLHPSEKHVGVIKRGEKILQEDYCRIFDLEKGPVVNYYLYNDYQQYRPYVEESRSCPRQCIHCVHSKYSIAYRCTSLEKFKRDFDHCNQIYGTNSYYTLLAANFGINSKLTIGKLNYLIDKGIQWSAEMHVENPWDKYIDLLPAAGMKSVSIGLETVSGRILKVMGKTVDGQRYVDRAKNMIREFHNKGVFVKVNIMSYPDETFSEFKKTLEFVRQNREYIDDINTSAIISFPNTKLDDMFEEGIWKHCYKMRTRYSGETYLFPVDSRLEGMSYDNVLEVYNNFKQEMNFPT